MPWNPKDYPPNWTDIRARILERAGNRCEWCGAPNHQPHPVTGSRVILTIAHLDVTLEDGTHVSKHDKTHSHLEALAALCQRCHLRYDHADHIHHAQENRRRRQIDAGQMEIGP